MPFVNPEISHLLRKLIFPGKKMPKSKGKNRSALTSNHVLFASKVRNLGFFTDLGKSQNQ